MSWRWNYTTTTPEAEAWRLKMRAESEATWKTIADMERRLDILETKITTLEDPIGRLNAAPNDAPLLEQAENRPIKRAKISRDEVPM